jgi:hypothetical protein
LKICRDCGQEKHLDEFHNHKKLPQGKQPYCKPCDNIRKLKSYFVSSYGITYEEAEELKRQQDYKCGVCGLVKPLHVDHCHKTNKVRGMLCGTCNRGLGCAYDNPEILRSMINWLEVH